MDWPQLFAPRAARMKASEIRELLKLLDQPDILSFAGGIPDPALFPAQAFAQAMAEALSGATARQALQYAPSEGYLPLRDWIAGQMAALGIPCTAENILVTSGSQQALDYIGKLMIGAGDTALVGFPTYLGALGAFNAYEPRFARLDLQANVAPAQQQAAAAPGRIRLAYVVPDFANPTGESLTAADRAALLDKADALDIAVIEDAAYQALRYDGAPVPPVLALEIARKGSIEACRTIYCGSFSKTMAPGLRLGWVCAARPVIAQLVLMKQAADLHSPTPNQIAMHKVAESLFDGHVAGLRNAYRERRDRMLAALARHMPPGVQWSRPEGGMFVWLTLPPHMDGAALLARSLETERVAFVPGGAFFADGSGRNHIRLSFSLLDGPQIDEGIARLGSLLAVAAGANPLQSAAR